MLIFCEVKKNLLIYCGLLKLLPLIPIGFWFLLAINFKPCSKPSRNVRILEISVNRVIFIKTAFKYFFFVFSMVSSIYSGGKENNVHPSQQCHPLATFEFSVQSVLTIDFIKINK